jgi:WD40 repeat protein
MNGFPSGFCPYKGLQPYTEEDRAYFFGRERDQEIIASNLYAAPLTVLYGASGVGKSSVLLAGVVPKLRQTPRLAIVVFRDWQNPDFQSALKTELSREVERSLGKPCGADPSLPFDDFLAACARSLRGPVFFLLDQFEEYFLYHRSEDGENGFDVAFARAINREEIGANFMLSMREDGLSKLDRFQGRIPNLLANMLRLDYLDREAATRAIRRPLDEYNRRLSAGQAPVVIEDSLVGVLLRDLQTGRVTLEQAGQGQAGSAISADARIETPFLQLVLTRLWQEEMAAGSSVLRLETLNRLGGTENIARTHLDTAMEELSETERDVAARMFRFLVTPSGSKIAQDLPSLVSWSEVDEATASSVLARLTSGTRILRSVNAAGQADRYEIFHDVLAPAILDWRRRYVQTRELRDAEKRAAEQKKRAEEQARAALKFRLLAAGLAIVTVLVLAIAIWAFRAQQAAVAAEDRATKAKDDEERAKQRAEEQATLAATRAVEAEKATKEAEAATNVAKKERENAETQERIAQSRELAAAAEKNLGSELGTLLAMEAVKATYAADGTVTNEARDVLARAVGGDVEKLSLPGHQGMVLAAAYSPDGRRIATRGQDDDTLRIWDADSGQLVDTLAWEKSGISEIAFSADGKRIASGKHISVNVRDISTGVELLSATSHRGSVFERFALSPDGKTLATASGDGAVRLWRSPNGTEALVFPDEPGIHETMKADVAFSADGRQLIIVRPNLIKVVDAVSGAVRTTPLRAPRDGFSKLSPSGKRLVTASSGELKVWDMETGRELWASRSEGVPIAFSADDSRLVTADPEGYYLWDVISGKQVTSASIKSIRTVAISPKGDRLAISRGDTSFFVTDLINENPVFQSWGVREMKMRGVAFSADGRRVAATSDKGQTRVWEAASGREVIAIRFGEESLTFSHDAKRIAAIKERDNTVALFDSGSGEPLRRLIGTRSVGLFRAAFSPDGSRLATVGFDHTGGFWDLGSGKELLPLSGEESFSLAFSQDGRLLATGGRPSAIWDIASRRQIHTFDWLGDSVAFSPDGQRLAIAGFFTAVFDVASGREIYKVSGGQRRELWSQGAFSLAFSPDGKLLATVLDNKTVKIWNAHTGTEQMTLYGHGGDVRGIAFSADGSELIAISDDWTTHVHPLPIEDLMALAREKVKRDLTPDERRKYLHQP